MYKRQYVICGVLVGIGALFFVATYTTVQPGYGDQYNNEAIAGCVMGGTSMVGGLASIGGTVIGVFIISLLQMCIRDRYLTKPKLDMSVLENVKARVNIPLVMHGGDVYKRQEWLFP